MTCYVEDLIAAVTRQLGEDIKNNDTLVVYELLEMIPQRVLEVYLEPNDLKKVQKKWQKEIDITHQ